MTSSKVRPSLPGWVPSLLLQGDIENSSFVFSHVSNDEVLQRSGVEKLSIVVRGLQLKLLDRVLTDPRKTVLKDIASLSGSMLPVTGASVGRRGRPRQNWIEQLLNIRASK